MEMDSEHKALEARIADLERINKALIKLVSHDVRSPLNKLYALTGLFKLSDSPLSDEQQKYLDKMEVVISDGLNKMKNVMDLYAIETAGVHTHPEKIDIIVLTKKIIREFTPTARRKHIDIELKHYPEVLPLITDRLSYVRIMDQLLSNAYKYTPESKTITINIEATFEGSTIAVIDGGYGIKTAEQQFLFQKFKVLSSQATGGETSVGLGLFIARWHAQNLGGDLKYDNNGASTFTLTLQNIRPA